MPNRDSKALRHAGVASHASNHNIAHIMPEIALAAPAKINLYLEVLGRRADGFHELETVFQTLDLGDDVRVSLEAGQGISLSCDDASLPHDHRNLAWRAAQAFLGDHALRKVGILLRKRIPHGAGLGGGSSDAAAVLRALSRLLPEHRSRDDLFAIAAELGSDVPFFLLGGTALGHGRGERLRALPDLARMPVTVLMPLASVPTPAAFAALTDDERGPRQAHSDAWWQERLAGQTWTAVLANRLTPVARRLCPAVGTLLDHLAASQVPHLMSGSGAACFALAHIDAPSDVRAWRTHFRARADLDSLL
jgi:4-diphosphocytidyl-2-C-methyl-D-erythritol kinase